MSKRKRDLTEEEQSLWTRVTERVKQRRTPPKTIERKEPAKKASKPPALAASRSLDAVAPARAKPLAQAPSNRGGEKRVRRGKLDIGAKLDLHGHTQESARTTLIRFLQTAQRRGDRTVIVITGLGRMGGGVLRQRLPGWLGEAELRGVISGYAQAHRTHGGAGAYYVFLKVREQ